jgi:hypothetical protein
MEAREVIRDVLTAVSPNASVARVEETAQEYRITVAGTTGVVANCLVPREAVAAAATAIDARERLAAVLKRCADDVVAPVADGRA